MERQDGYVVAQTALLLIPLMIFAALAVDVGAWYRRAQQVQVGADSAALAGVPLLPDFAAAKALALETAARNGFVDQPGCDGPVADCVPTSYPQVLVTRVSTNRIEVTIFSSASVYLGRVVMSDDIDVTRYATAEVTPPVPLGIRRRFWVVEPRTWSAPRPTSGCGRCPSASPVRRVTSSVRPGLASEARTPITDRRATPSLSTSPCPGSTGSRLD